MHNLQKEITISLQLKRKLEDFLYINVTLKMTGEDCIIYAWFLWCINGDSCLDYVLLMILLSKGLMLTIKIIIYLFIFSDLEIFIRHVERKKK